MNKYLLIISIFITQITFAQNNRQNIRGVVTDKLSQTTLPGATVQIINKAATKGTVTDANGNYVLPDMAPDRYEIKVSYIGYKDVFASNVVVTSGKEVVLDIAMEENYKLLNEVVITANRKAGTINNLVPVSARTFSTEEVNRYAGG
ncbi:MAG: carboxypeptidase-like regulatory domain-containing protein, partial [Bacteroidales bacterium]